MIFYFIFANEEQSLHYQRMAREIYGIANAKLEQLSPLNEAFNGSVAETVAKALLQTMDKTDAKTSNDLLSLLSIQGQSTKQKLKDDLINALAPENIKPALQLPEIKQALTTGTGKILSGYYNRYRIIMQMASKVIGQPTIENYHLMALSIYLQHIAEAYEQLVSKKLSKKLKDVATQATILWNQFFETEWFSKFWDMSKNLCNVRTLMCITSLHIPDPQGRSFEEYQFQTLHLKEPSNFEHVVKEILPTNFSDEKISIRLSGMSFTPQESDAYHADLRLLNTKYQTGMSANIESINDLYHMVIQKQLSAIENLKRRMQASFNSRSAQAASAKTSKAKQQQRPLASAQGVLVMQSTQLKQLANSASIDEVAPQEAQVGSVAAAASTTVAPLNTLDDDDDEALAPNLQAMHAHHQLLKQQTQSSLDAVASKRHPLKQQDDFKDFVINLTNASYEDVMRMLPRFFGSGSIKLTKSGHLIKISSSSLQDDAYFFDEEIDRKINTCLSTHRPHNASQIANPMPAWKRMLLKALKETGWID